MKNKIRRVLEIIGKILLAPLRFMIWIVSIIITYKGDI